MTFNYCFTFSTLEMSVRYGDCNNNNNDDIIGGYVHMGLERAKKFTNLVAVRHAHMRVLNTLIETMCDNCLSSAWRKQCYRYIKRLLPLLYEMLDPQQYQQKTQEIQMLYTFYFEANQNSKQHRSEHKPFSSVKKQP